MDLFKNYINRIIVELSYRVGAPDLTKKSHVEELMEVMLDMGIPPEIRGEIRRKLLREEEDRFTNPILNKTITYKDTNGEQQSNTVGNLLTLQKEHPGRIRAEQELSNLSKEEYDKIMGDVGDQGKTGPQKMKDEPEVTDAGGEEGPGTITGRPAGDSIANPTGDYANLISAQEDALKRSQKREAGFDEEEIKANFENSVKLIDALKDLKWEDGEGVEQSMDIELTDSGGILIGVMHNTDGKYDKQIKTLINQIKKLPPTTKVMYVGEGGMERNLDNSIDFSEEMGQIRDGISDYFKQFQETSWDERANIKDTSSKVFDVVAKSLGGNKSKSKAAIWSNMIGQGTDLDPNVYLDREGKEWLIAQAKKGGSGEFDRGVDWSNLTDAQKEDLYQLNFRDDGEYGETEIYKAQVAYNDFRQSELDRKIKEAEEQGYVVIAPMGNSHVDMWRGRNKEVPKETPEVETPEDMKQIIPKADYDIFNSDSDITKIDEKLRLKISTQLDGVYEKIKAAKDAGGEVPNYNLCQVTIPGTNLYCDDNQGIPRDQMPQFKGKPVAGSPAAKLKVDASGEVDTEPIFKSMLVKNQIRTVKTKLPSDKLKATQSELVGEKVLSMVKALEADPNNPNIKAPIYVSRDGYVVDGHHRWAAVTTYALKVGEPADMDVIVVDQDIKDLIPMANKFAEKIGIAAKKADTNDGVDKPKEEPKVTDDPLGAEATMDSGKKLYHIGKGYYSDKPGGNAKYIRVESVVERVIETDSKKWWKLLFAENITATVQGGKDGVFKEIPKDEQQIATDIAKLVDRTNFNKKTKKQKDAPNGPNALEILDDLNRGELNKITEYQNEVEKNRAAGKAGAGGAVASEGEAKYCNACNMDKDKWRRDNERELQSIKDDLANKKISEEEKRLAAAFGLETNSPEFLQILAEAELFCKQKTDEVAADKDSVLYIGGNGGFADAKVGKNTNPKGAYCEWMKIAYLGSIVTEIRLKESKLDTLQPYKVVQSTTELNDSVQAHLEDMYKKAEIQNDKDYYKKQLETFKKFREYHDTFAIGKDENGRTTIVSISNKKDSQARDPQNNTTPAQRLRFIKGVFGEEVSKKVSDTLDSGLEKVADASINTIRSQTKMVIDDDIVRVCEEPRMESYIAKLDEKATKAGDQFFQFIQSSGEDWASLSTKRKLELMQEYANSRLYDKDGNSRLFTKEEQNEDGELVEVQYYIMDDGTEQKLTRSTSFPPVGLPYEPFGKIATKLGEFKANEEAIKIKQTEKELVKEVHTEVTQTLFEADSEEGGYHPEHRPNADNGKNTQGYILGTMKAIHIDTYIDMDDDDDGAVLIQMGVNGVKPSMVRECVAEKSGFTGDINTPEGKKALKEFILKRCRVTPGGEKISVMNNDKEVELFTDQWRTAGTGQKVASYFGNDMRECLQEKAKVKIE